MSIFENGNLFIAGQSAIWFSHYGNQPTTQLSLYHFKILSYYRDICSSMFIAALLIIARNWKQPGSPSIDKEIMKTWYIYTMQYY